MEPQADWHLVNGTNRAHISGHDWLEDGHLAVDVTADQFEGLEVYVGPAPAPASSRYERTRRHELSEAGDMILDALASIREAMV